MQIFTPKKAYGVTYRDKNKKRKVVIEVFVAAEAEYFRVGHISLRVADCVNFGSVEEFSEQRIDPQQHIRTDACEEIQLTQ